MFTAPSLPLTVAADIQSANVELLLVPVFEDDDIADVPALEAALGGEGARARGAGELTGKPFELLTTPVAPGFGVARVTLVGAGARSRFDAGIARRVAVAGALAARQRRATRVGLYLRGLGASGDGDSGAARLIQAAAEGLTLAQYEPAAHKSTPPERIRLDHVALIVPAGAHEEAATREAAERGRIVGEATNVARALANEPGNLLTPRVFAERTLEVTRETGLQVEVIDESGIRDLGMGLLLGVAQGSAEPPRLIVLRHDPGGLGEGPVLGLVGKGITFDTGGISIKPAEGMERMKVDMSGGAAVVCAMRALALLGAPVRAIGVVPCTENMPGGRAMRPGDVLRSAAGKTVEVVNTDAEGRLVLGDALWYARQLGATHLVDVATLTGACVVALGRHATGLFGRPDDWVERVGRAAGLAGERCWPMPTWEEYFEQLKSDVADMTNTGGRLAGAVTAAMFLKQFAGDGAWAHLDIAGTCWIDEPKPWQQKGASGTAVATLVELALGHAAGGWAAESGTTSTS